MPMTGAYMTGNLELHARISELADGETGAVVSQE